MLTSIICGKNEIRMKKLHPTVKRRRYCELEQLKFSHASYIRSSLENMLNSSACYKVRQQDREQLMTIKMKSNLHG